MREVLQVVVPPLVPRSYPLQFVPHEGKKDLEKSIPHKLRAWRTPGVQFVVVRDKDAADCTVVKKHLIDLCNQGHRPDTLVRVVCHHLESWFLGDLAAVEKAYGVHGIAKPYQQKHFENPDRLSNAEEELRRLVPAYQKIGGSRLIAPTWTSIPISHTASKRFWPAFAA